MNLILVMTNNNATNTNIYTHSLTWGHISPTLGRWGHTTHMRECIDIFVLIAFFNEK